MKLLAFLLVVGLVAARKAPKKFESALEMSLDAPPIESSKDQLFCVAPPDAPAASLIFGSIMHNAFKAPAAQFVVYLVLIALYARTRVLKATGKKEYYREEKTE